MEQSEGAAVSSPRTRNGTLLRAGWGHPRTLHAVRCGVRDCVTMQRIDEEKRKRILEIAGRLFQECPFHDVRLEDVAAKARIGKGTIYIGY